MIELAAQFEKRFPDVTVRVSMRQATQGIHSTVLFGPSGCGKTTILRCLAGLERPEAGFVRWGDETWFDAAGRRSLPPQKRRIGYLFQEYALFPFMTVAQNVAYGLERSQRGLAAELLERFGLGGLEARLPRELSGGQQQRVALARAVIRKPRLLLLDEPLSALDAPTRTELRQELGRLLRSFGVPTILVTHDPLEAMTLADRVIVLEKGSVLQQGRVEEVFGRPVNSRVARIVGTETVAEGRVRETRDGMVAVRVGGAVLYAVDDAASGAVMERGEVDVCIRAQDVSVQCGPAPAGSARNRLAGRVTALTLEGPLARVGIDCGFPLTALVTRASATQMQLGEGMAVTAIIKATAIRLLPRYGGAARNN